MTIINWFLENILKQSAIFMGLLAGIGLIIQKKKAQDVIEGALLTSVGYLVFNSGSSLISGAINSVNAVLLPTVSSDFGVYPYTTNCVNVCYGIEYLAQNIIPIFVISWFIHIVVVKILNKWFKAVFMTVHMMLNMTAVFLLFFYCCMGLTGVALYVAVITLNVLYFTISPMLVYKEAMEMSDGGLALGHTQQIGAWFGSKIAAVVGKGSQDADNLKLPGWLSMFQQQMVCLAISMPVTFLIIIGIALIVGNAEAMAALAAGTAGLNWVIWCLLKGFNFAAGLGVLTYGLRVFLGSMVPAFKGYSEKFIPGAVPAIDCAAFFGYSPMGVLIGFIGYIIGGLIVTLGCVVLKTEVFVFPSVLLAFFDGGCVGVFSNKKGGWKGCLIASIICGFIMHFGGGVMATGVLGMECATSGFTPGNFDPCIMGLVFWVVAKIAGKI